MPTTKVVTVVVGSTNPQGAVVNKAVTDAASAHDLVTHDLYAANKNEPVGLVETMARAFTMARPLGPAAVGVTDFAGVVLSQPGAGWTGGTILYGSQDDGEFNNFTSYPVIAAAGGLQLRRSYSGNWTSTIPSVETTDFNRGVVPWNSFSGPSTASIISGSYDTIIASYFGLSNKKKMVTYLHEVDNGKANAPDFRAATQRIMDIKRANCPRNDLVLFGPILMGYTFSPLDGSYQQWLTPGYMDFIGTDPYDFWRPPHSPDLVTVTPMNDPKCGGGNCVDRSFQYLMGTARTWSAQNGNPFWAVGEYSCHPDPANLSFKPNWLQAAHNYMAANNFIAVAAYNGPIGASGPWWFDRFHTFAASGSADRYLGGRDQSTLDKYASLIATGIGAGMAPEETMQAGGGL